MRTPPGFDPARKFPVIVQVYGGPTSTMVNARWADPADQLLLEAGYILFRLDNRGTPNRGVAFRIPIDRAMGTVEADDQVAGARWLAAQPYVDAGRIGITGWSYGGYSTLLALTAPDTPFRAGMAGAPVTDWALYDTAYTERFMGTPQANAQAYARADILSRIGGLKPGALMVMHGMADDNVTFDHTTRLIAALQAKAVPFEMMAYPGLRHRAGWTPLVKRHRAETVLGFFGRKLRGE
jgi:dipeptidyl-peptidase-4